MEEIKYVLLVSMSLFFGAFYGQYDALEILRRKYEGGGNLNHKSRATIRACFCGGLALLTFGFQTITILGFFLSLSALYLIFDLWLNDRRDLDPFYLGMSSAIDKWLITRFSDKAGIIMFCFESTFLIILTIIYFT